MSVRPFRVLPAALAAAALAAGIAALPAHADTTTPPYEPDAAKAGTITFYDASGTVITGGKTDGSAGAFAAYAVGTDYPRAGDSQGELLYANPQPGASSYNWYRENAGLYTQFPLTSGPANIVALAKDHPVVATSSGDQTLDGFESDSTRSTATGYANMIQIRLRTATSGGRTSDTYDVADVLVDPSAHTWTQVYPSTAPAADNTSLALTGTRPITYGASLTVVGTLKDTTTNTALAGQPITLRQRASSTAAFTTVKTVTTSSTGAASVVVKPTANVQYQWSYAGTSTHLAVSSVVGGVAVAPSVTIAQNHTSIKRGSTVSFYGTVAPTVANQKAYLQRLVGTTYRTTASYGVVKTQKLPNGRTALGYVVTLKLASPGTFRYRAYVPATSTRAAGYSAALNIKVT